MDKLANGCKYAHRVDLAPQNELLKEVRTKGSAMSKDYKLFEIEFNKYLEEKSKIKNFVEQFKDYKMLHFYARSIPQKNAIED